jgi:hypothetical protein
MCIVYSTALKRWLLIVGLALVVFVPLAACQPLGASPSATASRAPVDHVPVDTRPQFARVTFTASTSYDQARALVTSVGQTPYPWACSDLYFGSPTPVSGQLRIAPLTTPPPSAEQDTPAAYAASHHFLLPYPTQQQLSQLANSQQVTAIDAVRLPACL